MDVTEAPHGTTDVSSTSERPNYMTLDEAFERWERIDRLMCENAKRSAKRSREQTQRLKAYVDAVGQYDLATTAMEARPEDLNTKETLVAAKDVLNRAREELRSILRH